MHVIIPLSVCKMSSACVSWVFDATVTWFLQRSGSICSRNCKDLERSFVLLRSFVVLPVYCVCRMWREPKPSWTYNASKLFNKSYGEFKLIEINCDPALYNIESTTPMWRIRLSGSRQKISMLSRCTKLNCHLTGVRMTSIIRSIVPRALAKSKWNTNELLKSTVRCKCSVI